MAIQEKISSVEANAFLTATANNKADFEDSKRLFKESLEKALKDADKETRIIAYQQAIRGFLLQLGQEEADADKIVERMQKAIQKLAEGPVQDSVKLPWLLDWGARHYRLMFIITILLGILAVTARFFGV